MTQIIFLHITREFFSTSLHTMNCFVTYSKSCTHLSLSFSHFIFTSLFIPLFSHFHSFSLPTPTQYPPFLWNTSPRGWAQGAQRGIAYKPPVHTTLMAQRPAQEAKRRTHKPCNIERRPEELRQVHKPATQTAAAWEPRQAHMQAMLHRGQLWWDEREVGA